MSLLQELLNMLGSRTSGACFKESPSCQKWHDGEHLREMRVKKIMLQKHKCISNIRPLTQILLWQKLTLAEVPSSRMGKRSVR